MIKLISRVGMEICILKLSVVTSVVASSAWYLFLLITDSNSAARCSSGLISSMLPNRGYYIFPLLSRLTDEDAVTFLMKNKY